MPPIAQKQLEVEIKEILHKVAAKLAIKNYDVKLSTELQAVDGWMAEFYEGSVTDKDANKTFFVTIKKAGDELSAMRKIMDIPQIYKTENFFYTHILPAFERFQRDKGIKEVFEAAPKHYVGIDDLYSETVVMENLKCQGYMVHDKTKPLDEEKIQHAFRQYGKFHALSYALKHYEMKEYRKLIAELPKYCNFFLNEIGVKHIIKKAKEIFDELDENKHKKIIEKFKPYSESADLFLTSLEYTGQYDVILHGDCSNNILFKYNANQKIESMKMIDFQLSGTGTPVHDLSSFLYGNASKEQFGKWESYLDIYYESFSSFAKELNCDPEELYPKKQLMIEWKQYGKFGVIFSFSIIAKVVKTQDQIREIVQSQDKSSYDDGNLTPVQKKAYFASCIEVLQHAVDSGIL